MDCKGVIGSTSGGSWRAMMSIFIHLLVASVAFGAVTRFSDEPCQTRPRVIELKDEDGIAVKPYHILLYRCEGTCDSGNSPQSRPCSVKTEKDIHVEATTQSDRVITVVVQNHTSCGCDCKPLECDYGNGEYPDSDTCECQKPPDTGETGRRNGGKGIQDPQIPFIIGMALVGFFALCVLVFDAVICSKGQGVMHTIKTKCCSRKDKSSDNASSPSSPSHETTHV